MNTEKEFPPGTLAVVATPLGHLDDLSPRALAILTAADIVAAEDTRTAIKLLGPLKIPGKLVSYHDWNEAARARWLVEKLREGSRIALVSDAGTPGISDPGFDLVREARRNGLRILPVPGPSALITFLSVSGLPTDAFSFFGFPPSKKSRRRDVFSNLVDRKETLVFYESPHRFKETLTDALEIFGDRQAAFGREMTKIHEEFFFGQLSEMASLISTRDRPKGEITWGLTGNTAEPEKSSEEEVENRLRLGLATGRPLKELSRELSTALNLPAKEIYYKLISLRDTP